MLDILRFVCRTVLIPLLLLAGCSGDSGTNAGEPGPEAPSALSAEASPPSRIDLVWTDNSGGADGFVIERKTEGAFAPVDTAGAGASAYADSGLAPGTYTYRVAALRGGLTSGYSNEASATLETIPAAIVADHSAARFGIVPESRIAQAKESLHIAYGHTSHGSQIITGMTGLTGFRGAAYSFNAGGTGGALDLRDTPFSGAYDLGNPNRTAWAGATRAYLDANPEVNVVMWSWCGQVSTATAADIDTYLSLMDELERDYPAVRFVYMTGHLDGAGLSGNLHLRNEQIREYCRANGKVLYDFADIESWNPDGVWFGDRNPTDNCDYFEDGVKRNWALEWQTAHQEGVDWYSCSAAHSQPLNANLKAYAAWWLFARLAGWTP